MFWGVKNTLCPNSALSSFSTQYPLDICGRKCFIIIAPLAAMRKHLLWEGIPFDSSCNANMQSGMGYITFTHPLWNSLEKTNIYLSCLSQFYWQSSCTSAECHHPQLLFLISRNECQHLNSPFSSSVLRINTWNPPLNSSLDLRTH